MIYSRSAEYAIRALIHMAELTAGEYALVKQIGDRCEIPAHFLAKILQDLARLGFLNRAKDRAADSASAVAPEKLSLLKIVDAVDGPGRYRSLSSAAMPNATIASPAGLHDSWMLLRSRIIEYLEGTSVADLAKRAG